MLRKLFTLLAVVAMAIPSHAIIWECDNFNATKMTCRIKGWSGSQPSSGKLKLPSAFTHTDGKTYTVTAVRKDALNDLTDVTEITIPATIVGIGEAKKSDSSLLNPMLDNFVGCTSLVTFKVEEGNPFFVTDTDGALYQKGYKVLYKVPAKMDVDFGMYKIKDSCKGLIKDAFTNNTTVKELYLPNSIGVYFNGGLNRAKNISKYYLVDVDEDTNLSLDNGCLIDKTGGYMGTPAFISCPPASSITAYKVPSHIKEIAPYAFANTKNLLVVDLGNAEDLNERLFNNSSVEHVTIPKTVKYSSDGLCINARNLVEIDILAKDFELKEDFARNCHALTTVTSKYTIPSIKSRAFMSCESLTDFPFDAGTEWGGDSIMYKAGIRRAVFTGTVNDDNWGSPCNVFINCANLSTIDMSGITPDNFMYLGKTFVKKCSELRSFIAPNFLWFYAADDTAPAFNTTNLSEIVLGSFVNVTFTPAFRYSPIGDYKEFTPYVYLALTRNRKLDPERYASMPLRNLFQGVNGAKVTPFFFCDLYDPTVYSYRNDRFDHPDSDFGNGKNEYIASRGIYYVPGGCADNYKAVKDSGRQVKEMFKFSVKKDGSKMVVKTWTGDMDWDVTNLRITVNDDETKNIKLKEEYTLSTPYKQVGRLLLTYKVNGVELSTLYPASFWDQGGVGVNEGEFSGVEDIDASEEAPYSIFNTSGLRVAEGCGEPQLNNLTKGIYILSRNGKTEKVIVR